MHEAKPLNLHRKLPQAAAPGQSMQTQSGTKGEHIILVQQTLYSAPFLASAQQPNFLICKLAPISADWLRTCSRSVTMQPTPTWARPPSLPRARGRSGGPAACARLGNRTGGRQQSATAEVAPAAPTRLPELSAPAMTWPTTTEMWQRSGTGRPRGKGCQRLSRQAAVSKQPGGVASWAQLDRQSDWQNKQRVDAPSVAVRPAATRQGSQASEMEQHTCWLSGTGKPMRRMAGTQTRSLWARTSRCTGSCRMSASWA